MKSHFRVLSVGKNSLGQQLVDFMRHRAQKSFDYSDSMKMRLNIKMVFGLVRKWYSKQYVVLKVVCECFTLNDNINSVLIRDCTKRTRCHSRSG